MANGLTIQQQLFVNALFETDHNATAAARAAGYRGSSEVLAVTASRLLSNAKVASCVRARLDAEGATADRIIQRLALIAFMDLDSPYLKKTEYDRNGNVKSESIDLTQVVKATSELAKIRGLTRQEIDVNLNGPVRALIYNPPKGFELSAHIEETDDDTER